MKKEYNLKGKKDIYLLIIFALSVHNRQSDTWVSGNNIIEGQRNRRSFNSGNF